MRKEQSAKPRGGSWRKLGRAFMAAVVAMSVLGVGVAPSAPRQAAAQPLLLQLAARQPDARVGVIVQKLAGSSGVEAQVAALGGTVTRDLSIINAFSANLPAGNVAQLAKTDGVRWVSLDAPVVKTNLTTTCTECVNTANLKEVYPQAVGATQVWNTAPYLQGQGIGVAVVDSGIKRGETDLDGVARVLANVEFNSNANAGNDGFGHGTHVAGIIGGSGKDSSGMYIGVAPKVNLINVKVSDDYGAGTASDVVAGLQWVLENKAKYNIRVVNMSLNSSVYESYHTNPINAAVEILWFNSIVVVVSAGNLNSTSPNALFPPANDPFVITVGAATDNNTASLSDDTVAKYSGYGTTLEGFSKPDLVAPGTDIISLLSNVGSVIPKAHPEALVSVKGCTNCYLRMSGTSMASPVVAGAVALLLQDEPNLTPDQVKYRLMATATKDTTVWPGYDSSKAGAGYLNIPAAIDGTTTASANTGTQPSLLLSSGIQPLTWNSVNWNSVNWNSVNWNSVNWNSVNWNSVNWNSTYWEP